ncbi:MAG: patatin-like phospholipase family protein [Thermodesulfobacteriota bacterium]
MVKGEFKAVVFAGGGNRCVWQAGFWEEVAPALPLRPAAVATVSAGTYMAAMVLSGRTRQAMAWVRREMGANRRNFYLGRLLRGQRPFPHLEIYGRNLSDNFDAAALETLRRGPELRVLLARPPRWCGPRLAVWVGFAAYALEKHLQAPLHPTWAMRAGFRPEVATVQACRHAGELKELLLATACTPPILPVMRRGGRPVLDGGLVDNAPVLALRPDERPALVLLTRRYPGARLRGHAGLTYIQPSAPTPAGKWDYTDPDAVQRTYDLGRADGRRFLAGGPEALQV